MNTSPNITLGTVQFGLPYGVANKGGQPGVQQSHELLQYALELGVKSLDTAREYGSAEEVIGTSGLSEKFLITSKFKLSNAALTDTGLAVTEAEVSVRESCKRLRINRIPILLLHKNPDQDIHSVAGTLPKVISHLTEKNLIKTGGISVFDPAEINYLTDWDLIKVVQAPLNLLDTRLIENNLLPVLIQNSVNVYIRSIYLQGLLLLNNTTIPPNLQPVVPYLNKLQEIALKSGVTVRQIAFTFVRDTPGITGMIIGADDLHQLKENMALTACPALSPEVRNQTLSIARNIPETLITPAFWNKLKV